MKKMLLLAAAVIGSLTMSAQSARYIVLDKNTVAVEYTKATPTMGQSMGKFKAGLEEGLSLAGYSDGDDIFTTGGITSYPCDNARAGSELPAELFNEVPGATLVGMRFNLAESIGATNVSIEAITKDGNLGSTIAEQDVPTTTKGWNTVMFNKEVSLPVDNIMSALVSFAYKQTSTGKPLAFFSSYHDGGFLYYATISGYGTGWFNFDGYDVALQLILRVDLQNLNVSLKPFQLPTVAMDSKVKANVEFRSNSKEVINTIDYTVECDGVKTNGTATMKPAIQGGLNKAGSFPIEFTAPHKAGAVPVTVTINKVNGETEFAGTAKSVTCDLNIVSRVGKRFSVVEEFTGTGCGFCPRGWVGMNLLKETMSDQCAVIAIHRYNSTDPMYPQAYKMPNFSGAPSCTVDRTGGEVDPYYATSDNNREIDKYVKQCTQVLPEVEMNLTATYTEDFKKIQAVANTEFLTDLPGSSIVFVATADGLTGTSSAWKQSNYYTQYSSSQLPADMRDFASGGKYGQSSVTLVFDDVAIATSWSTTNTSLAPKFKTTACGETATTEYNVTMPTKTTLKAAIKYDKVNLVAFVLKADGTIANAVRCKVEYPEGIDALEMAPAAECSAAYDLQGRLVKKATTGLFIQNGKKIIR